MNPQLISKIENMLQQIRFQTEFKYKNNLQHFYSLHPDVLDLENKKRLVASDRSLKKEEKNNALNEINKSINNYLSKNNVSLPCREFLCEKCFDKGYLNDGSFCDCFKRMAVDNAINNNEDVKNTPTFDDFNDDVFDESILPTIKKIRNFFSEYSNKFPNVKKSNIYIYGNTGTGKTFLLSCLYNELKRRGISVIYVTAGKLFDMLRKYALNQIEDIDLLLDTEMLIIDDLGTEPMFNNITIEYMFLLFNERKKNDKATCISSNLDLEKLKMQYNERIASRIIDKPTTSIINMPGKDLRTTNYV